jgi:hypothetical protein
VPYKIYPSGDQFCVHKVNADGSMGEKVACHASQGEADAQLKALYANEPDAKEAAPATPPEEMKPAEDEKKPVESLRTMVFAETVPLRESVVDKAHKTVEVTLIKPGWSLMGRYYGKETLGRAVSVFEGTKAFKDHPSLEDERNRPERSVTDITGYYTNIRQAEDGSIKGVRHFVGKAGDELYPLVLEAIANKPDLLGLSINAMGKTKMGEAEGRQGVIVEDVIKSFSVDDVTTPSAGGKYERLMQSGNEMTAALLQNVSYEEWRSANPEFEARIKKEMRTARKEELDGAALKEAETLKVTLQDKDTQLTAKDTEIAALNETVKGLQTQLTDKERDSATRVNELRADLKLLASKLPADWCQAIRPQLLNKTAVEMDAFLESEKKKFFSRAEPVIVTNAGIADGQSMIDPKLTSVLEGLGTNAQIYPLDGESPEQYGERKRKMKMRS